MKTHNFIDEVRQSAKANDRVWTPGDRTQRNWPLCLTCGRDVDAAGIRDMNLTSVEVWGQCRHLAKDASDVEYERARVFEDFFRVSFPFRLDSLDEMDERVSATIRRAMGDATLFDPTRPPK